MYTYESLLSPQRPIKTHFLSGSCTHVLNTVKDKTSECLHSEHLFHCWFFGNGLLGEDNYSSCRWKNESKEEASFVSFYKLQSRLKKTFSHVLIKDHMVNFFPFKLLEP